MPLFETVPVDVEEIKRLVAEHWGLELGACLKASQNHTFVATSKPSSEGSEGKKFIVRVTPDPEDKRTRSTELELDLLTYLHANQLPVCPAVPTKDGLLLLRGNPLSINVFEFASGEAVNYLEFRWMTEKAQVVGLGRWIARLHILTRRYTRERPEQVAKARVWTELHDGVLATVPVSPEDEKTRSDPAIYGLIHGDVNPSNFHWIPDLGLPHVFDWDQLQLCWFLYDVAQPILGVVMLSEAGKPVDGAPVPEANPQQYTEWLLEGYEGEIEKQQEEGVPKKVDRAALDRMVKQRIELYRRFCTQGVNEVAPDSFMGSFMNYINNWLSSKHPL